MQSIASIPAAIYYIDPDKRFVYTDVDTPNAPFDLSDQPDHVTTFGYREMEILMDGTNLANDVMCWGIGYGSQTPVFVRDEDATSQSIHGLWQLGQTTFGVYRQATIDRIAASIIDGSPQSKRGAKNDRPAVMVVTHQGGLRVADKVDFTSAVFGYEDVIPIRKMVVEFEGPDTPKYTLTLSHEIDTPFSFFDPFLIDWHFPKVVFPPPPPPVLPEPGGCGPTDGTYEIFDSFSRVLPTSWGTADAGRTWLTSGTAGASTITVNGSVGTLGVTAPSTTVVSASAAVTFGGIFATVPCVFSFTATTIKTALGTTSGNNGIVACQLANSNFETNIAFQADAFSFNAGIGAGVTYSALNGGNLDTSPVTSGAISSGTIYVWLHDDVVEVIAGGVTLSTTAKSGHGSGPPMDITGQPITSLSFSVNTIGVGTTSSISIDNISIKDTTIWGTMCSDEGVTINAWVCEQFDGAAALLTLAHPFLFFSPQVWVDGLLINQSEYTMDPLAGTITLDSPPGPSGTARVCYWSLP
jgi:hypothetical protein